MMSLHRDYVLEAQGNELAEAVEVVLLVLLLGLAQLHKRDKVTTWLRDKERNKKRGGTEGLLTWHSGP